MSAAQEGSFVYLVAVYLVSLAICLVLTWQYWRDPNMKASERSTAVFFAVFVMVPISIIPVLNSLFAIYLFSKWHGKNMKS